MKMKPAEPHHLSCCPAPAVRLADLPRPLLFNILSWTSQLPRHPCCKVFADLYADPQLHKAWLLRQRPTTAMFQATRYALQRPAPDNAGMVLFTAVMNAQRDNAQQPDCSVSSAQETVPTSPAELDTGSGIRHELAQHTSIVEAQAHHQAHMQQLAAALRCACSGELHVTPPPSCDLIMHLVLEILSLLKDVSIADPVSGKTALHLACEGGLQPLVLLLLGVPGVDVRKVDSHKSTPLMAAADAGHRQIIPALLAALTNTAAPASLMVDLLSRKDAFLQACWQGHRSKQRGANVLPHHRADVHDGVGGTALHAACARGHLEVVRWLLGLSPAWNVHISCRTTVGLTPLHIACSAGHVAVVHALLAAPLPRGLNVNARCFKGLTPLQLAVQCGHVEVVQLLLSSKTPAAGRVDVNVRDFKQLTALDWACWNAQVKMVRLLLQHPQLILPVTAYHRARRILSFCAKGKKRSSGGGGVGQGGGSAAGSRGGGCSSCGGGGRCTSCGGCSCVRNRSTSSGGLGEDDRLRRREVMCLLSDHEQLSACGRKRRAQVAWARFFLGRERRTWRVRLVSLLTPSLVTLPVVGLLAAVKGACRRRWICLNNV